MRKFLIVCALLTVLAIQPLASAEQPTKSTIYSIQETHQLPNSSSTTATNVVATIFLFDNHASQQILSETIEVDGVPASPNITRTEENRVASFSLGTISGGDSKTITITNIIKITQVGPIDSSAVQGSVPSELLAYTQPIANLWESDYPTINTKALELIAGKSNIYDQAEAIFDFVKNYLTYSEQTAEHSALWADNNKIGDCSEFTHLFSALCRAAGIPTMFVSGYGYNPQKGSNLAAHGHAWAFIYLPGVEWTPMDLIWQRPQGEFAMLSDDHIIRSTSSGPDLVSGSEIHIPSNRVTYQFSHGQNNPNINFASTGQIVREVDVEPQLSTAASMEGDIWKFYVTVTNAGAQAVTNLNVALSADSASLEVPSAQSISSLAAGGNQIVTFNVRVNGSVENSVVTAHVTYDSSYGTLLAEWQSTVNVTVGGPSGGETNIMLFALICVVIVLVVAVAAVVLLRR
ncbi:MAG: transglutaminase-like domain-containing protein [Candidatus Hadarchaeum sp.]|nr:transglutaminase-like domain-containing protein [Candidatus Hadarchaeum sp.]